MVVTAGGMASLVILGLIALFLSIKGVHILVEEKFGFITGSAWEVITDETGAVTQSNFGIGAMLIGTMLSAVIAISVGVPISVLSALYLTFYANGTVNISQQQIAHFKGVSQGDIQIYAFNKPEPLTLEHQNFRDAVLGIDSEIVTLQAGTMTVEVAESIIKSTMSQTAVNL
jgi:hypothetical protein